jgi:hypothetical protein
VAQRVGRRTRLARWWMARWWMARPSLTRSLGQDAASQTARRCRV